MIGWLQCQAGASGDMLLGALVDCGAPLEAVREAVDGLGVDGIAIEAHTTERQGIAAAKVDVRAPSSREARTWADVRGLVETARLHESVRALALEVFARLAGAEATAHGTSPEAVHFHEVGAADALADVVGTCAALHALGITELTCSAVALGTGTARGEHGTIPVPGPAVLALLHDAGAPVYTTEIPYELCTPTGAALLAATVSHWGGMPPMSIARVGAGAGTRELDGLANMVRLVLGEPAGTAGEAEPMLVLETNIDDADPRIWPSVLERLLEAGAADAWLTPILMKKGRPAHILSALVDATTGTTADAVRHAIFAETSTLGIRELTVHRSALERSIRTVEVGGCPIRVKVGYLRGVVCNAQPEYEDVAAAAAILGRPVRDVLTDATAAARAATLTLWNLSRPRQ